MKAVGTISEGEWNSSFSGMSSDEADFMAQLLDNCSLPNEVRGCPDFAVSWPASYDETNMYSWSSGYSGGSSILFPSSSHQICVSNNNLMTMDYCLMMDGNKNHVSEGYDFPNQDASNGNTMDQSDHDKLSQDFLPGKNFHQENNIPSELSKKRPRIPRECPRSKKMKKSGKVDDDDEDYNSNNNNNCIHRQSSSDCCSEDDSNAPSSSSKGIGINEKTRAGRGSATDPQSLYARKRRERINERLRILQNLVPNGTKVDISTMLEEAVQYVKFLQLQIKLLSSDDLWMYSPIAYNGMELGLDLHINSTPKSQS